MSNAARIHDLERTLAELVRERQELRAASADPADLERNRREIVARQHELGEALIAQYAPGLVFAAA